jgi:hypothetical protein
MFHSFVDNILFVLFQSVPLWSEYLNFIQERDESVSQCTPEGVEKIRTLFERALTAAGLHVVDGGKLWAAYREFEQALLITMEENSKEVGILYLNSSIW